MDKNLIAELALGPIDTLDLLKKRFPHDICFYARVGGEVFGELPVDVRRALEQRKSASTGDGPSKWEAKYKFREEMAATEVGKFVARTASKPDQVAGLRNAMQSFGVAKWGGNGAAVTKTAGLTVVVIRDLPTNERVKQ